MDNIYTKEEAKELILGKFDKELLSYLKDNSTAIQKEIFGEKEYTHIVHCLKSLVAELFGLYSSGELSPILQNNLFRAVSICDDINVLALNLYVKFLYNKIPAEFLRKK